ncbi:hypothetical protein CgIS1_03105 [Frankia sp. CgS1]|nr:hypothetical protein CgIS1_03105 [Frankia sp. CgIS1]
MIIWLTSPSSAASVALTAWPDSRKSETRAVPMIWGRCQDRPYSTARLRREKPEPTKAEAAMNRTSGSASAAHRACA